MRKSVIITLVVVFAALFVGYAAYRVGADKDEDEEDGESAELAKALRGTKVPLDTGLSASEREGQPISGKFEVEDGKLQLSVYTAKEGKFFEVIVDHMTGTIAKVEPITEGEDFTHAKSQKAAMDRAKVKLADAATKAKGLAKGEATDALVVSAVPELKDDRPEASIVLLTGKRFSTVSERLD